MIAWWWIPIVAAAGIVIGAIAMFAVLWLLAPNFEDWDGE